jgi:GLPGLI family protein
MMLLLAVPLVGMAQEGIVTYEETVKLEIKLPPEMEHMSAQIPNARTVTKQLFFNESASLMKNAPEKGEEENENFVVQSDDVHIEMRMEEPENETYVNFDEGSLIEKRDFLGRTFLITGEPAELAWRLTDERSEFLGYMAQKAVTVRDSMTVEAWFTPEIPVPAGPDAYGGLPGLILVLNVDDGQTSYVAQTLLLDALDDDVLVPPTKGKKVTRDEFDAIVEEKMKEMGVERGGNRTMIRISND